MTDFGRDGWESHWPSDADLLERAVRGARSGRAKNPRWHHVANAMGVGSTVATSLCRRYGLNPDEKVGG